MPHIVTLNGDIINSIRHNIEHSSALKTKDDREKLKFAHCLFLTQDKNVLTYQTVTPYKIVQISTVTDSVIPYPLAINLEPVHLRTLANHQNIGSIDLEIPDCTFANLQTFHDINRPEYIKTSDLQTNIVKIGNQKTNLEYLDNIKKYTSKLTKLIHTELEFAPINNVKKHEWNIQYLYNLSHIFLDYPEYYYLPFPDDEFKQTIISELLTKISKFGYLYRTVFDKETYQDKIQTIPIAIFEKVIKDTTITALLLACKTK